MTAKATRALGPADSCWAGGFLRVTQGTGTAERTSPSTDVEVARAQIETAKAVRAATGVTVSLTVIGLPPVEKCDHATLELDGDVVPIARLKYSGGTLTARAERLPTEGECRLKGVELEVIPPSDIGPVVRASVRITGDPPTVCA
jgi:hypothetical protein